MSVYRVPAGWSPSAARLVRADWEAAKEGSIPTVAGGAEGEEWVARFKLEREDIPGLWIVDNTCSDGTPRCYARWESLDARLRAWAAVGAPIAMPAEEPEGLAWPREWALKFVIGGLRRGELTTGMAARLLGLDLLEIRKIENDMRQADTGPWPVHVWVQAATASELGDPGPFGCHREHGAPDYITFSWEGVRVNLDAEGICYLMVGDDSSEIGSPEDLRDALDRLARDRADEGHRDESFQTLAGVEGS